MPMKTLQFVQERWRKLIVKRLSVYFNRDPCFRRKEGILKNVKIDSLLTIKWINPVGIQEEQEFIYLTNIADSVDIQGNSPIIYVRL